MLAGSVCQQDLYIFVIWDIREHSCQDERMRVLICHSGIINYFIVRDKQTPALSDMSPDCAQDLNYNQEMPKSNRDREAVLYRSKARLCATTGSCSVSDLGKDPKWTQDPSQPEEEDGTFGMPSPDPL